jgi:hypothetical protein
MNMQEIRQIASNRGIKAGRVSKQSLVHRIQLEEGNFACFGAALDGECDQYNCLWRVDCLAVSPMSK